jgi:hypothetical protein
MSYIGKTPATGNFVKLDAITTSSTNTYNLLKDSVAFTPESANHMIVSLNGVIQAPLTAFTVSGSTITFIPSSGTLSSSDSIDFILVLGNVLDIGTPSDDTISASKLKTDSVIEAKIQDDAVTRDKINAISTSSLPAFEAKGTSGQTDGYIQLNCEQNTHGIKLKSPPHSASQSYTLTFPSTAPANNKYLQTNSSGVLSFADVSSDFVFISTTTISSSVAQVDIDYDYSTYKQIFHFIEGIQGDADTNIYARFKVSGSIDTSSVYSSNTVKKYYNGFDSATYGGNNQSYMYVTNNVGGDTYESWTAQLRILLGSGTGMPMMDLTTFYKTASGNYDANFGACGIQNFYQIQGIRLYPSTGNFDTGKIHTYGVK